MADNLDLGGGVFLKSEEKGSGIQVQASIVDIGGTGSTYSAWTEDTTNNLDAPPVSVRYRRTVLEVTPTISTAAYEAGDAVGGVMEFTNAARDTGTSGLLRAVTIIDAVDKTAALELFLFSATVTAVDADPFDPSVANLKTLVARVSTGDAAWDSFATRGVCHIVYPDQQPVRCAATSLFGVLMCTGTPDWDNTNDLTVLLHLDQD